jgi:hypothetical protein
LVVIGDWCVSAAQSPITNHQSPITTSRYSQITHSSDIVQHVLLPLLLIVLALVFAGAMTYGTSPALVQYQHGLQMMMLARRLQWPLVALSLLLCVALLVLVISGKRRAWWLIGLAPIVALFFHHFAQAQPNSMTVCENPSFVEASAAASFMNDNDWVVGLIDDGQPYAYPYKELWSTPIVIQSNHDRRLMLLWSPLANCAKVFEIDHSLKARDLEVVAMPASALLVYNARVGQFINAVRGERADGGKVSGLEAPIASRKMSWKQWKILHADTRVMSAEAIDPSAPAVPIAEKTSLAADAPAQDETRIAFIPTTQPLAIAEADLAAGPINTNAGTLPVLVFRDEVTGVTRAFDRRVEADLIPRFESNHDPKRKDVRFVDRDTGAGWSANGVAIDGSPEMKGKKLRPIEIEGGLYWGVMKHWYPNLELFASPSKPHVLGDTFATTEPSNITETPTIPTSAPKHAVRSTKKRAKTHSLN